MPAKILKSLPANQAPPLARAADGDARAGKRLGQNAGWRWKHVMDVYLVRHAIAHERNSTRWPNDALRPLTTAGMRKFRKAAAGLARCVPKTATVFTSPYVRARETAAVLAESARFRTATEAPELTPGKTPRAVFELLRKRRRAAVVLVGHEPDLSAWVSAALAVEPLRIKSEFKKGGAVCVRFEKTIGPGCAVLVWMLPPRVLRAMR
jgi:phosphohistidine phosphatase